MQAWVAKIFPQQGKIDLHNHIEQPITETFASLHDQLHKLHTVSSLLNYVSLRTRKLELEWEQAKQEGRTEEIEQK